MLTRFFSKKKKKAKNLQPLQKVENKRKNTHLLHMGTEFQVEDG